MLKAKNLIKDLKGFSDAKKSKILSSFFKTGKGEYGEGDKFLGITVPKTREAALIYKDLPFSDLLNILKSPFHEIRLAACMILVSKYKKAQNENVRKKIFDFYIKNTKYINNWDLVDLSCHYIVGPFLKNKNKSILYKFARSKNIWERRISIISTFEYIRDGKSEETFKIAKMLLKDKHDLIHKAVGWMLREVGKKCGEASLDLFLKKHIKELPRTTLRYAIERMKEGKRKKYLNMR